MAGTQRRKGEPQSPVRDRRDHRDHRDRKNSDRDVRDNRDRRNGKDRMPRIGMEQNGRLRDPAAHLLFRTKLCKFYSMGACTRGRQCAFAHDFAVLRNVPNLCKTSLCPQLMKFSRCDKGDECNYAHSKSELRAVDDNEPLSRNEKSVASQKKPDDLAEEKREVVRRSRSTPEPPVDMEKPVKVNTRNEHLPSLPVVRSPLRVPFNSPKRLPEIPLNSPHFCPTSPPWRPLSPSFDDSMTEGRPRFDSHGCVFVKNTFLEFVPGEEEEETDGGLPLRRASTWGYNLSEPDDDRHFTSYESTTVSCDEDSGGESDAPKSSRRTQENGTSSSRLPSGQCIVMTGLDDE